MFAKTLLFTPGDSERKMLKAAGSVAGVIIFDLEDSVAPSAKEGSRARVASALKEAEFGQSKRFVRVNTLDGAEIEADVQVTLPALPDGYTLPKVETAAAIQRFDHFLAEAERAAGIEVGRTKTILLIETPLGVVNMAEIVAASTRTSAIALGGEDLMASLGARPTPEMPALFYARSKMITVAAAYQLPAYDTVYRAYRDRVGLEQDCRLPADMGFAGKIAIHPAQVDVIERAFAPTPAEVEWAHEIIGEFEKLNASGIGVFSFQGQMIDEAHLRKAKNILKMATSPG